MEKEKIKKARDTAEEIAKRYNPKGISPFPYETLEKAYTDLSIFSVPLEDTLSGAIEYQEDKGFQIYVNRNKPSKRRYFTLAHELGHFFLHSEIIKGEKIIIDGEDALDDSKILFRPDNISSIPIEWLEVEREANNFAASLIMPEDFVRKVWNALEDVDDCAEVFGVSAVAMSIRLKKLHLIE